MTKEQLKSELEVYVCEATILRNESPRRLHEVIRLEMKIDLCRDLLGYSPMPLEAA